MSQMLLRFNVLGGVAGSFCKTNSIVYKISTKKLLYKCFNMKIFAKFAVY